MAGITSIVINALGDVPTSSAEPDEYAASLTPTNGALNLVIKTVYTNTTPYVLHLQGAPVFILRIDASATQETYAGDIFGALQQNSSVFVSLKDASSTAILSNTGYNNYGSCNTFIQANVPAGTYTVDATLYVNTASTTNTIPMFTTVAIQATPVTDFCGTSIRTVAASPL